LGGEKKGGKKKIPADLINLEPSLGKDGNRQKRVRGGRGRLWKKREKVEENRENKK